MRQVLAAGVSLCVLSVACAGPVPPGRGTAASSSPVAAAIPVRDLPVIDADALMAHTRELSSDRFEGRGPGTRGEDLTVQYLVDRFTAMGLKPGNPDGTYLQHVPLVGISTDGAPLRLAKGANRIALRWRDDVIAWTKHVSEAAALEDSELVFVGYGVVAPEFGWDDYKGLDVRGKTLVMLVNDPPIRDPKDPSRLDPAVFGGAAMTYYGRWSYKYEIAAEKGAAGALIVHETGPAGYAFSVLQASNLGEKFDLATPDRNMGRAAIEGWTTVDAARRVFAWAGQDFDALKARAATRAFAPVPLGVTASLTLRNTLRRIDSRNVAARIEGRDPELGREAVVYTAHWDHLGVGRDDQAGPVVYHGARDNAVGVAGLLEVARAFARLPAPPKRSVLFLAVTAEEQGLFGSQYYATHPFYPPSRTAANINMDGLNVHGRTRDLTLVGFGASDLDDIARAAAAEQGRVIRPDPEPEKGLYYRSDHFNFAKLGIPALDPHEGVDFVGKPPEYGVGVRADTERRYHQPSDVVTPEWTMAGTAEDLALLVAVGLRVADAAVLPDWKPGSEFKERRARSLREARGAR